MILRVSANEILVLNITAVHIDDYKTWVLECSKKLVIVLLAHVKKVVFLCLSNLSFLWQMSIQTDIIKHKAN